MPTWNPETYLTYADERGRPFLDLINRIGATAPTRVVDLGCGPGNLTELLAQRWPDAAVLGVDSSPEMIAKAETSEHRAAYSVGDLAEWRADELVDVIVSNATLQWLPEHLDLLPQLLAQLAPGGWLAFQVPHNQDQPSARLIRELSAETPYAAYAPAERIGSHPAQTYLRALQGLGCAVDAWETNYLHVLTGPDPVFTWISGTGARPTLEALPADLRPDFETELKQRLRTAYPDHGHGAVFPFHRIFAVAQKPPASL